ncbi:hypothetical protein BV25DRAFT_1922695 [Artomyces pyxidatus]|uniref:Uncharacterized protein n=1 Tax=Artomyces pyxidatus TaxID=48021 RepID=A0ACB8SDW9_9AGAM|nr:hypothetical protein BV25DRAFT_1922695 [Artomyces pyxidatus]
MDSIEDVKTALDAAQKYQVECLQEYAKAQLRAFVEVAPERVYAIALMLSYKDIASVAARATLTKPGLDAVQAPEFASISGSSTQPTCLPVEVSDNAYSSLSKQGVPSSVKSAKLVSGAASTAAKCPKCRELDIWSDMDTFSKAFEASLELKLFTVPLKFTN